MLARAILNYCRERVVNTMNTPRSAPLESPKTQIERARPPVRLCGVMSMLQWTGGGDVQHVLLLFLAPTTGFVFMLMTLLVAAGKVGGRRTAAGDAAGNSHVSASRGPGSGQGRQGRPPRPTAGSSDAREDRAMLRLRAPVQTESRLKKENLKIEKRSSAPHLDVRIDGGLRHDITLQGAQSWAESSPSPSTIEENYSPACQTEKADVRIHSQSGTEWPEDFVSMATLGQYTTALMPRQKQGLPKQTASNEASEHPGRLQELHTAVTNGVDSVEAPVAAELVAPPARVSFLNLQQPRNPRPSLSDLTADPRFGPLEYAPFDFSSTPAEGACPVWKIMLERNEEMRAVQRARLELLELRKAVSLPF